MAEFVVDPRSLNRWIKVHSRSVAKSTGGRETITWPVRCSAYAAKRDISGREQIAAGQINPESVARFIVRWRSDIVETDRVKCDGVEYDVTAIAEIGVRQYLDITGRRVIKP